MPQRSTIRWAAVDGPDQQHLTVVKVFDWDGSYRIVGARDNLAPKLLRRLGLKRYPDRWVDITGRPDIKEGDSFPFQAAAEPPPEPSPVPAPADPQEEGR